MRDRSVIWRLRFLPLLLTTGACSDSLICVSILIPQIRAEIVTPDGQPAAAGARVTVDGVDEGWAAPVRDSRVVYAGERSTSPVTVGVDKPWYEPVILRNVQVELDQCGVVEPTTVHVSLALRPGAPPVRSVYVGRVNHGYSGSFTTQLSAVVDVEPGVSESVMWWSSDTSVAVVDSQGILKSQCRASFKDAFVGATSVVDPTVRDSFTVSVGPPATPGTFGC